MGHGARSGRVKVGPLPSISSIDFTRQDLGVISGHVCMVDVNRSLLWYYTLIYNVKNGCGSWLTKLVKMTRSLSNQWIWSGARSTGILGLTLTTAISVKRNSAKRAV